MAFNIYTDDGVLHQDVPSVEMPANAAKTIYNKFIAENDVPDTPSGELKVTQNGEYNVTNFAKVAVAVSEEAPTLQEKTVTPSTSAQTVTPDSGYDGLSQVTVGAVQVQEKTVTPSTSAQTVTPDTGKYLSKVTVEAVVGEPVLSALAVSPTAVTVPAGTAADGVKSYLTAMSGTYTLTGYTGTLTKDLTSAISSVTVGGTMPTAGSTAAMTVSYGGKSAVVSVTMEAAAPTLTGLSVSYTGGTVAAGTTLAQLTEVVKATYSDGTTSAALTKGTDYTLSGTLTAGQANTVTVTGAGTYAGLSATFSVTVEAASSNVSITYDTTMSRGSDTIQLYDLTGKPTTAPQGSATTIELTPSLNWLMSKMPSEYIQSGGTSVDTAYTYATNAPISVNNNGVYEDKAGTNGNSVSVTPTGDVVVTSVPFIWMWGCGGFWVSPDSTVANENVYAPVNVQGTTHLSSWSAAVSNLMPIKSGRTYKFNMTLNSQKTRVVFLKWNGTNYASIGLWKTANITSGEVTINCDNLATTPSGLTLVGSVTDAVAFAIDITGVTSTTDVESTLKKCYVTIQQR